MSAFRPVSLHHADSSEELLLHQSEPFPLISLVLDNAVRAFEALFLLLLSLG